MTDEIQTSPVRCYNITSLVRLIHTNIFKSKLFLDQRPETIYKTGRNRKAIRVGKLKLFNDENSNYYP